MTNSKHRPPDHNGSQPDDAREPDREMPDREMPDREMPDREMPDREIGVSGLPRAKLQYITGGYGFGMRQRDREGADG